MTVPKCKGCKSLKEEMSKTIMNPRSKTYWCMSAENFYGEYGKNILSSEIRTSPKWCPKRGDINE